VSSIKCGKSIRHDLIQELGLCPKALIDILVGFKEGPEVQEDSMAKALGLREGLLGAYSSPACWFWALLL